MITKQLLSYLSPERREEMFQKNDAFEAEWRPKFKKPDEIGHAIVDFGGTLNHLEKAGILTPEEVPTFLEMFTKLEELARPYLQEAQLLQAAEKSVQTGAQA